MKTEMQGVSVTGKLILEKYEEYLLKSMIKCELGEKINTDELQTMNDCIRTLHHIVKLRGYAPVGENFD